MLWPDAEDIFCDPGYRPYTTVLFGINIAIMTVALAVIWSSQLKLGGGQRQP